jgi:hypothetical protein
MRFARRCATIGTLIITLAESARADDATNPPAAISTPRGPWYGWQSLIIDAPAVSLLVAGAAAPTLNDRLGSAPTIAGGVAFVLGGPIVHWAHGSVGKGFASLGLRVVIPVLAELAFYLACFDCSHSDGQLGMTLVLIPALLVPAALDDFVLAYEPAGVPSTPSSHLGLTPTVGAVRDAEKRVVPTVGVIIHSF